MAAPWAAVPLPGGRPVPSGWTFMSQAASPAALMGFPNLGPCADAALVSRRSISATRIKGLCVDMLYLAVGVDRPTRRSVVVLRGERGYRRRLHRLSAMRDDLRPSRFCGASLIPRPALQYGRTPIPSPGHPEACKSLREHRFLQRR